MLGQDQFVKGQLALTAWREASKYGGHKAMMMIAQAIANRKKAGWGTWMSVIENVPVFSAKDHDPMPPKFPDLIEPNFVRLLQEIDGIYANTSQDLTSGGLYWADTLEITRDWFKQNILADKENHPRVANMNTLTFWK